MKMSSVKVRRVKFTFPITVTMVTASQSIFPSTVLQRVFLLRNGFFFFFFFYLKLFRRVM